MGIQVRVRQDNDLRLDAFDQFTQVSQQIIPGWQAINVTAQGKWIESAEISGIAQLSLTGRYGLGRCALHGRQLQAEVAQLNAALLRHAAPQRNADTVPGAQRALQPRRFDAIEPHLPVVPGLDFTGGDGHDPALFGAAVQAECGQLGVVGVGRDHHHPLTAVIRMFERREHRLAEQSAETSAQTQLTLREHRSLPRKIEVTQTIDATLEGLAVRISPTRQLDNGIDKASQPGAFYPQRQDQGGVVDQHHALVQPQPIPVQMHLGLLGVRGEAVLIIVCG
ncbi:hypothetical protein D3C85_1137050 [compost metagenome]